MDLPMALENVLEALLKNHTISNWKVGMSDGYDTPHLVLRFRPNSDSDRGTVNTQVYRRKQPSQVARDKQRLMQHKKRLEQRNVSHSETAVLELTRRDSQTRYDSAFANEKSFEGRGGVSQDSMSGSVCERSVAD